MSQENVEVVRRAFAAFEGGDLDRLRLRNAGLLSYTLPCAAAEFAVRVAWRPSPLASWRCSPCA